MCQTEHDVLVWDHKEPFGAYKHVMDIEDLSLSKVLCLLKLKYVRRLFFLNQDDVWTISELNLWL
jgi:hypothetical protein